MESHSLAIFVFLFLAVGVSQASVPPQVYWNSMLPNTPMPKTIKDIILRPNLEGYGDSNENGDGKNRLGGHGLSHANISVSYDASKNGDDGKNRLGDHGLSHANISVSYDASKSGDDGKNRLGDHGFSHANISISYEVGKNGDDGKHKLGRLDSSSAIANITISYDASKNGDPKIKLGRRGSNNADVTLVSDGGEQFDVEPKAATVFFLLKDMVPGAQMNLVFPSMRNDASFMPRYLADSIPFSSNELPETLNKLSIEPESTNAKIMETTIKTCEQAGIKGESKVCATSLESMIDFTTSNLGKQLQAVSSEVQNVNQIKKYKFMKGIKKLVDDESVVCHSLNYPYAVFYCHAIPSTSVYMVHLEAIDGPSREKAIAVCHKDTSAWNPNHVAFEMVNAKPGTLPICHFPGDSVIWGRK